MSYDIDPTLTDVPIHASELDEALASGTKELLRDQRKFMHLMGRVIAAMRARTEDIQQLQKEIAQMRTQSEQVGRSSSLNPVDAVRYLSKEQVVTLFGKMEQERLAAMERETARARAATAAAGSTLSRARYELLSIVEDEALSAEVRERVRRVLAAFEAPGSESAPHAASPYQEDHWSSAGRGLS